MSKNNKQNLFWSKKLPFLFCFVFFFNFVVIYLLYGALSFHVDTWKTFRTLIQTKKCVELLLKCRLVCLYNFFCNGFFPRRFFVVNDCAPPTAIVRSLRQRFYECFFIHVVCSLLIKINIISCKIHWMRWQRHFVFRSTANIKIHYAFLKALIEI